MMSVYNFDRSDAEILQELVRVFNSGRGTAREQWSAQAELIVEPVGWDALWKLSKQFCKRFGVRFPCIAYVTVTSVDFEALSASLELLGVQHENVSLPEEVGDVPLIELWPTTRQREQCVNEATTAEFIELLRFYYKNIWMPWDDQDDKVVLPNTIEDRMRLWVDLKNGTIPICVSRKIMMLRGSAIDAYERLKELDNSLCDEGTDEDDSLLPPSYIAICAELSARLDGLMSEWTLYENPLIREQYLTKARAKWQRNRARKNVVALWQGGPISEFEELSKFLQSRVSADQTLTVLASAEEALALEPEELVICSPKYDLPEVPLAQISICGFKDVTLQASEMRTCLLTLSVQSSLRALRLSCARVHTVLVARAARHALASCALHTDANDVEQAIVAMPGSQILIENCTIDNFYSGIIAHKDSQVELRGCTIRNCGVGIQIYPGARVILDSTSITGSIEASLRCDLGKGAPAHYASLKELQINPNCRIGSGDLEKEILIVQQDPDLLQL